MGKIIVGLKKPLEDLKFIKIENDYEVIRGLVGGNLECITLEDYTLYLDDTGMYKGLPINLNIMSNTIVGTIIITRIDETTGDDISLTSDDEKRISSLLGDYTLYKPSADVTDVLKNMNLGLIAFLFKNSIEGSISESINNFYDWEETLELLSSKYINSDIDKKFVLNEILEGILGSDIFMEHLEDKYDIDVLYFHLVNTWETIKLRLGLNNR